MDCCPEGDAYEAEFSRDFARSTAQRYLRRGLSRLARRMVDFVQARGIADASVLEIGGGVGYLSVELLRRGAATATNLELSPNYEDEASQLVARYGLAGRLTRRRLDIARDPAAVAPADVVIFHRVVCCYPDSVALLRGAGGRARSLLVMSYPTANPLTQLVLQIENWRNRRAGRGFRGYLHDPAAMIATLEGTGLRLATEHRGPLWSMAGFERRPGSADW